MSASDDHASPSTAEGMGTFERYLSLSRLIHEADLKTKIADGILLRNQNVPARI